MTYGFHAIWQWVGDRVLGAAGRAARLDDGAVPECIVPGQAIRPPFQVIEGGKGPGMSRPVPIAGEVPPPQGPVRRAS